MSNAWRQLVASSIICYVIGFGIVLLSSVFAYSSLTVLPEFQWAWIMARSWEEYLELLPVAQAWAVVLVFGLIVPMGATSTSGTSFERFGSSIVVVLVFAVIFAVVYLVGFPAAVSRVETLEFTTDLARQLRDKADDAISQQDYSRAIADLEQYAALVGSSESVDEELRDLRETVRDERQAPDEAPTVSDELGRASSARELIDRAVAARTEGDYSTAHYMAVLALALAPQNDEATRIAAEALARLEALTQTEEETAEGTLFRRKQDAKAALTRQDYVSAYYQFAQLVEDSPQDLDARRYLVLAQESVSELTVFYDEVTDALALPGAPDLAFVNQETTDYAEVISIGKLVQTPDGVYAQDVELIQVEPDGGRRIHLVSDYGQILDDTLILNVISRGAERNDRRPRYISGQTDAITEGIVSLVPDTDELFLLAAVSRDPASASITALSRTITALESYGLLPEPIRLEFLQRLVTPFAFVIISLFSLGFAWRFRSRYLSLPPVPTLVLVPTAPLLILPAYLALLFAQRLMLGTLLLAVGFGPTLALLIAIQGVLLLLTLMYVALGSRE